MKDAFSSDEQHAATFSIDCGRSDVVDSHLDVYRIQAKIPVVVQTEIF